MDYRRSEHPEAALYASKPSGYWTTGWLTCFCPCVTFGRIAEIVDEGRSSCCSRCLIFSGLCYFGLCPCLYSCTYRTKLRAKYALPETPCSDCCTHFWCTGCALNQEYRELRNRGLDPAVGWAVNVDRRIAAAATAPPYVELGMTR
ncbi:Protein PLANT CADMIUM RESISTANCE 7 [Morella rubra]|uniref:Protein PLANT CADMIUM RESISTANCE 7 n=1 Tax=Morella rubra TaxID=262757 RepID=A0A6A1VIK9_9ROSI|nr:Protein PLANT CADMIUM RESISTANCE 7 [Morella rubra]KAB1212643.1 Protein PLANT CADMIUM RESISTANCE 7 [Morella rubra]